MDVPEFAEDGAAAQQQGQVDEQQEQQGAGVLRSGTCTPRVPQGPRERQLHALGALGGT